MTDPDSLEFSTGGGPIVNLTFPRLKYMKGKIDLAGNIGRYRPFLVPDSENASWLMMIASLYQGSEI